jgi:methyltransferase (TIGR00027 family)
MDEQAPSRTAFGAAAHRAAHQVLEKGAVFSDPLALAILGPEADAAVREAEADPSRRGLRLFIAARSTIAETALASAVLDRGVRQLVVLGAGLDTFACRNPFRDSLHVFEVDHPLTQAWKRRRLVEAGVAPPPSLTFVPVNFEREDLLARLVACGFAPGQPSFFTWLGVAPYLTRQAVFATLAMIGALSGAAEVVFDYSDPPHTLAPELRAAHEARAARVAALGEPFLSYFEPADLHPTLRTLGFAEIDDLRPPGAGRPRAQGARAGRSNRLGQATPNLNRHPGNGEAFIRDRQEATPTPEGPGSPPPAFAGGSDRDDD